MVFDVAVKSLDNNIILSSSLFVIILIELQNARSRIPNNNI